MSEPLRDFCEDKSDHLPWINFVEMKKGTGRVIACTVADFMKKNDHLREIIFRPNKINLLWFMPQLLEG